MLQLDPLQFLGLFRKPGGYDFTRFMNDLIGIMCAREGIPPSDISTCSRTEAKDGGVDTRVRSGREPSVSGHLATPSIWQFKAADKASLSEKALVEEVNKWHAKKCIQEGHGYRLCVCDTLTDAKKTKWEDVLRKAVRSINPSTPEPKILSVDDVARLANDHPALVMSLRPNLQGLCKLFDRWGASARAITPTFVPSSTFNSISASTLAYADFTSVPPDPLLPIHGLPGVGKTRATYEAVRTLSNSASMVLYTDDEDRADELATLLVNEPTPGPMIIVVDDCSLPVRLKLQNTLRGFRECIRCICISDGTEMPRSPTPELSVSKMSSGELEEVLRENFPGVPFDRLRTYAHLANGFVRLAADMCQCDGQIKAVGNISPTIQSVRDYYHGRLTDAQRRAVEAITLVTRVKRKGQERTQLDSICEWLTEDRHALEEQLAEIKEAPGFVERGALYYRVTPEIIAIVAFENAWKRWGDGREEKFLSEMPKDIQEAFLERVSESAGPEVRKIVRLFFRRFGDSFSPQQLSDPESVKKLITLINTEPDTYLPPLRSVVSSATDEDFQPGPSWIGGEWGPRRQLVWLAEGLAQFKEFFRDAETILFQLAVHETELDIGNNATHVWQRLFCMQMSGTPLPFSERLRLLEERLKTADEATAEVFAGALRTIFNFHGVRLLGAPVIGGRIPEPDWYPENRDAYRSAIREGLSVLVRASRHPVAPISVEAQNTLVSSTELLTRLGWLDDVKQFVTKSQLDEDTRAKLVADLKYFLGRRKAPDDQEAPKAYLDQVEAWIHELEPGTLHGRLVEQVGANSWSHYGREKEWEAALASLAQQLLATPHAFEVELPWLLSPEAKSAFELGHALGAQDSDASYLDIILSKSEPTQAALARGYVSGIVYRTRVSPALLNERLDQLEEKDPLLVP